METPAQPAIAEAGSNVMLKMILTIIPAIAGAAALVGLYSFKKELGDSYIAIYWLCIPLFIYAIATVACIIAQYTACKTVHMTTVANTTWQILFYIFIGLGLGEITAVRAPVVSLFPFKKPRFSDDITITDILTIESIYPGRREKAIAYWLFWLTLFGQMIIIGKTTICKSV